MSPGGLPSAVSSLLPLETSVEMQLLSTTRTEERLSVLRETFGAGGGGSCCVM